ncbi:exosortase-dependent surface protein XDP2 [Jannaschia formosa]|uniref:exosortase-dependent surface protein XDP2 n=1 Tax=Jannaschia formosa TaxID=2259592 RepID=UPI000E1C2B16|nr:exosortase-dependent surface protein XDP2 [Jannaschia formosa]TFL16862.1 VPLPA-CTERM sorting domain-containing protein [Jannaschia formosa]
MTPRHTLTTLALATTLLSGPAVAATVLPSAVTVSVPAGSTDPTGPVYTDDVLLDSLTFGTTVYDGTLGSFSVARTFTVTQGRSQINAEWGDTDTAADGNGTPFAKAGFPTANQETTDPAIQDATLLNAFNSRSLSEMTDGEGQALMQFEMTFENTLAYDDIGGDSLPDLVFFERGGNDVFDIELMIGGTAKSPIYSSALTINSGSFANSGFSVNTVEISTAQAMFVGGFDLSGWGLGAGARVGGFRLTTTGGPDLGGFFLSAEDPGSFGAPFPVPLPAGALLLLGAIAGLAGLRRRRG